MEAGPGLIPGLGGSSEEGNSNPLQYPCLESLMDSQPWGHKRVRNKLVTKQQQIEVYTESHFLQLVSLI